MLINNKKKKHFFTCVPIQIFFKIENKILCYLYWELLNKYKTYTEVQRNVNENIQGVPKYYVYKGRGNSLAYFMTKSSRYFF